MLKKKFCRLISLLVLISMISSVFLLGGCGAKQPATSTSNSKYGGTITVAEAAFPANLDLDNGTDENIAYIMYHVYEGLFEPGANSEPVPYLAQSYQVSNNGLVYDVTLRQGVLFQNGQEMTASDVNASFQRWLIVNNGGQLVAPYFDRVQIVGPYELLFKFKKPFAPFLAIMSNMYANQKLVVYPKELVDKFGDNVMTEYCGTGPYEVAEYNPGQSVVLKRFDKYAPDPGHSFGYSGKRIAYADEIVFQYVSEQAVRIAGVQTGEYTFAMEAPADQYNQLAANPGVTTYVISPYMEQIIVFNCGQPPFNNIYARQAVLAALNMNELGEATIGNQQFWSLNPSLFYPQSRWYDADAGAGLYNKPDPAKAKQLLSEAGYNGQMITILSGRDNPVEAQGAVDLQAQLEKVGFKVQLNLLDRAAVVQLRSKPTGWNIHISSFETADPDPYITAGWTGTDEWISNWNDTYSHQMDQMYASMLTAMDYQQEYTMNKQWQDFYYQTLPYIKTIDFSDFVVANKDLVGYSNYIYPVFWNCYLQK